MLPVRLRGMPLSRVPERIHTKRTPKERAAFEKALKEGEDTSCVSRKDKAVFYLGKVGATPTSKIAEDAARRGEVESVNSLSKDLLNRPEIRDVFPDDAVNYIDDLASKKFAEGASGSIDRIGDVKTIRATSVFRRIKLSVLLKDERTSPQSRAELQQIKRFLDSKYAPL